MALEGSWAGSLADLIGALASQGRLREAHRLYADLCKLGDSPDTLAHRARARELCCGPWADKVKGHVTPET
jgi:pentatricopeptide repeat protein